MEIDFNAGDMLADAIRTATQNILRLFADVLMPIFVDNLIVDILAYIVAFFVAYMLVGCGYVFVIFYGKRIGGEIRRDLQSFIGILLIFPIGRVFHMFTIPLAASIITLGVLWFIYRSIKELERVLHV